MNLGSDDLDVELTTRRSRGERVTTERDTRSLEEVLGPSVGRYFGHGYRGVRYGLTSSVKEPGDRSSLSAEGQTIYPPRWSVDRDGTPRLPHLSTIDATVLPLLVFEAASRRDQRRLSGRRVREVELRAAGKPWLELDAVPVTMNVEQRHAGETLASMVGNIRSRIVLSEEQQAAVRSRVDTVPQDSVTVYGGLFQAGECRSKISTSDAAAGVLHGWHEFSVGDSVGRPAPGIEADFWPSPTAVDYLVTMGQLTQALIYESSGTGRSSVGTLWMRTMTLTIDGSSSDVFETTTRLVRDRILGRDGRRLHDLVVESSATTGARVKASLAYEEIDDA